MSLINYLLSVIGRFGRFQLGSFLLLGFVYLNISWAVISIAFLNAEVDYWCKMPDQLKNASISVRGNIFCMSFENSMCLNLLFSDWKNISGQTEDDKCHIYPRNYTLSDFTSSNLVRSTQDEKVKCQEYEFDNTEFTETIASEWGLVCQNKYGMSIAQSVYFLGQLFGKEYEILKTNDKFFYEFYALGIVTFGILSDKIGRKRTFIPLTFLAALFGVLSGTFPQFKAFLVFRFFTAFVSIGKNI